MNPLTTLKTDSPGGDARWVLMGFVFTGCDSKTHLQVSPCGTRRHGHGQIHQALVHRNIHPIAGPDRIRAVDIKISQPVQVDLVLLIGFAQVRAISRLGVCAVGRLAPRKTGDVLPKVQPGIPDGISGNGRFQIPASARFSIVRVRVLSRFPGINPPVAFASA